MSCPLPHVLVMLNMFRRPALLFGEAPRRVIHPPCCRPCLLASCHLVLFLPVSPRCSPFYSSGGTTWRWASALVAIADVMRMSCGGWLIGSPCVPSAYRPASSTRTAGSRAGVAVACFFRISTVCRSRHPAAGWADLLACSYVGGRSRPAVCCARILWIASVAVAMAASP